MFIYMFILYLLYFNSVANIYGNSYILISKKRKNIINNNLLNFIKLFC